jgi:predicted amidophosphoribosyltransferase
MRFLIVDDVRTTGATLNACANVLAGTSPASVSVMTFAVDLPASVLNPWLEEYGPR